MSAYIVEKNHILYLLAAMGARSMMRCSGFSYFWRTAAKRIAVDTGSAEAMAELGNLLWRENMASVGYRYKKESSATLPGAGGDSVITRRDISRACFNQIDPVQVLKSCDCFEYQSCEHDGWIDSEAKAVIDSLRKEAWHALKGYDDAVWGAPEPMSGVVNLSAMIR